MRETNRMISKRHTGTKRIPRYELGFLPCIWSACARRASVGRQQISCSLKDGCMTGSNGVTKEAWMASGIFPEATGSCKFANREPQIVCTNL